MLPQMETHEQTLQFSEGEGQKKKNRNVGARIVRLMALSASLVAPVFHQSPMHTSDTTTIIQPDDEGESCDPLLTKNIVHLRELQDGSSIVNVPLSITIHRLHGERTFQLTVVRGNEENDMRLLVDGKEYACDAKLLGGTRISSVIDDVTVEEEGRAVVLHSKSYGCARMNDFEVERVVERLAVANRNEVPLIVHAPFTPHKGTVLRSTQEFARSAASLLQHVCSIDEEDSPFDVELDTHAITFARTQPDAAIAALEMR